jgi:hypothetical protein
VWQVDGEQTIQVVAEKRDTVTWLGGVRDKLVEEAARQACLERAPAGCADAQAVSLQAIHRSMIELEDLDFDVVPLQPLCQAQATCSCSNDADPEPFVAHRAPLHAFAIAERPAMSGDNDGFWQRFRQARTRAANARARLLGVKCTVLTVCPSRPV